MDNEKLYKDVLLYFEGVGITEDQIPDVGEKLLRSFCFLVSTAPKFKRGEYVVVKNELLLRIPNKEIYAKVINVIVDYNKCEILYSINFMLENEFDFKVIKESQIKCLQDSSKKVIDNYYGRDDLERFQYLQIRKRIDNPATE